MVVGQSDNLCAVRVVGGLTLAIMSGLRPIEKQFEPEKAQRIRKLMQRAETLRRTVPEGATSYYFAELCITLEAGSLLGSLHLAATTLELFVRALIIDRVSSAGTSGSTAMDTLTYQEQLEENRALGFGKMLDHLVSVGLFRSEDAERAKRYYQDVRTPLAHGLLERFICGRPGESNLWRLFGPGGFTGASNFEKVIDDYALDHIEVAIGIIERNTDG
jgi:hypothetical protein